MASLWQNTLLIALIVAISIPSSTSEIAKWRRRTDDSDDTERYLRDLCSETDNSDECWDIVKPEVHRFEHSDDGEIINRMIDLARERSEKIYDQLNDWYKDCKDEKLKKKYHSCSKNYKEIGKNLEKVQKNLDSDDVEKILKKIDKAGEKLDKCREEFKEGSFDRGHHVRDRNDELKVYMDLVRSAASDFEGYYDEDRD